MYLLKFQARPAGCAQSPQGKRKSISPSCEPEGGLAGRFRFGSPGQHLFSWSDGTGLATADDVGQVFPHLEPHEAARTNWGMVRPRRPTLPSFRSHGPDHIRTCPLITSHFPLGAQGQNCEVVFGQLLRREVLPESIAS
jgi:hypothetical protein